MTHPQNSQAVMSEKATLPFTLKVTKVTPPSLPNYLDPFTHPSPAGAWVDYPISTVMIDGELWIIQKNGYFADVRRYKGAHIESAVVQPSGTLNTTHPIHGTVVHPYLLGGMWYDSTEKKLYAPMHCEYKAPTAGDGVVLRQTHLAVSADKGLTWNYEGPLLTADTTVPPFSNSGSHWDGGDGDFYLYVDEAGGYFYIFTTFYMWPKHGVNAPFFMRHRVARCKISDKMASGKWQRFYNGGWTEPGIGGKASYVNAHRVIYSTYLKKYVSFNYGSGLSVCSDLSKQDWSHYFKIPGNYWGTQENLEIIPSDPETNNPWVFGQTLYLYTYLEGWNCGPGNKYRLDFGPGEITDADGYLGWGVGANAKKFWDPDWEGAAATDPLRPYGEPCYDNGDPIESRRVRKVNCVNAEIHYSGAWTKQDSPVLSMNSEKAEDSLSFDFKGSGIYWRALQGPDCGKADVFLDGVLQKTVDCYGNATPYKFWFVKTGLDANVLHTIKIVVRGDNHEKSTGTLIKHLSFEYAADSNQASDGFSSVMGKNDWHYLSWDGRAYSPLEFEPSANVWKRKTDRLAVGPDHLTPHGEYYAVRQWIAPHDGTVRVEGRVSVGTGRGIGVKVEIVHNATVVWTAGIAIRPETPMPHDFRLTVKKGDTVSFRAGKTASVITDTVPWNPMITYVESSTSPIRSQNS